MFLVRTGCRRATIEECRECPPSIICWLYLYYFEFNFLPVVEVYLDRLSAAPSIKQSLFGEDPFMGTFAKFEQVTLFLTT